MVSGESFLKMLMDITESLWPWTQAKNNFHSEQHNQSEVIEAFNSTSRYLDELLNIDNNFFDSMVNRIYPSELQLNKANVSDTKASFLDLHLSISDGFV